MLPLFRPFRLWPSPSPRLHVRAPAPQHRSQLRTLEKPSRGRSRISQKQYKPVGKLPPPTSRKPPLCPASVARMDAARQWGSREASSDPRVAFTGQRPSPLPLRPSVPFSRGDAEAATGSLPLTGTRPAGRPHVAKERGPSGIHSRFGSPTVPNHECVCVDSDLTGGTHESVPQVGGVCSQHVRESRGGLGPSSRPR